MSKPLINQSRSLRKQSTDAERLLWHYVKARQMRGLKFRRQQPIAGYIVDFVCMENKLVIELDGGQHALSEGVLADRERDLRLEREGFKVLRFWDNEVLKNTEDVLAVILAHCELHPPLNPLPSREGR